MEGHTAWDRSHEIEKSSNWKQFIEAYCERSKVPYFLKYSKYYNPIRYMGLKLDIKETDTVLDNGCGAGHPKEVLDDMGLRYRSYIGIGMSKVAIQRMKERKVSENALLICGDACKLPLKDSSVDKIFSYSVIEWLYSPDDYCREIHRVLKKAFFLTKRYAPPIYYLLILLFKALSKIERNIENTRVLNSFCRMLIVEVRK
ncbi:MAG: class I SAM-dependent methyltransferase [Methanophagales archaeon]|nr:class I SAM-dependent methyltransferase [Methanophagales archaeon]